MTHTLREGDEVWVRARVVDRESGGGDMGHSDYLHIRVEIETKISGANIQGDAAIIRVDAGNVVNRAECGCR